MSGLYSPINKLMEQVTRPKGTGAEYMAELQKKPGYKPAEAEDRDLQALMALPQMERAAFMEKLKGQANKFPLKHRELTGGQTHHETYTLPGGENYREILLHTPMPEGGGFPGVSQHFGGTPNILASIRVKDRTTPEGKKMLHLEEIQSDWHQQGREKGYLNPNEEHTPEEKKYGIPYGPHAKDWHELALKAMIQHAAENGYDQIGITPGAEQNKRYGLSRRLSGISYRPDEQDFYAFDPQGGVSIRERGASPERISQLVGKELAKKLLETPKQDGFHSIRGQDLEVGGEGMKGFYDRMVPSFLNKFGKKHGVQVQPGAIGTGEYKVVNDGHADLPHRVSGPEGFVSRHATPEEAQARAAQMNQAPVHTFDITPQMREDVLKNGIPRYDEGGEVKPTHELFHGTNKEFKSFDKDKSHIVNGVWLTQDKNYANWMARERAKQEKGTAPRVLRVSAYHNNPMYFDILAEGKKVAEQIGEPAPKNAYEAQELLSGGMGWDNVVDNLVHEAKTKKHDSLIIHNFNDNWHSDPNQTTTAHVVFDPNKLKIIDQQKYAEGGEVDDDSDVPRETVKAYKLFRVDKKQPGKLFPLFVDANTPVEMDKWITAKEGERSTSNTKKVKSKIGDLAYRPGWHAGDLPIATHIGDKDEEQKAEARRIRDLRAAYAAMLGNTKAAKALARKEHPYPSWVNAPRLRNPNHIWAEVEMPNDVDWQSEATKRGYNDQGKLIASQAHITDQLPLGGHYRYKTNSNMLGNWLIGGSMKVNRILPDEEVAAINKAANAADLPRAKPMNQKTYGFAEGGTVGPEEWMAEEHVNHKVRKATGGVVKDKVTIQPSMDVMQYELINRKAK